MTLPTNWWSCKWPDQTASRGRRVLVAGAVLGRRGKRQRRKRTSNLSRHEARDSSRSCTWCLTQTIGEKRPDVVHCPTEPQLAPPTTVSFPSRPSCAVPPPSPCGRTIRRRPSAIARVMARDARVPLSGVDVIVSSSIACAWECNPAVCPQRPVDHHDNPFPQATEPMGVRGDGALSGTDAWSPSPPHGNRATSAVPFPVVPGVARSKYEWQLAPPLSLIPDVTCQSFPNRRVADNNEATQQ